MMARTWACDATAQELLPSSHRHAVALFTLKEEVSTRLDDVNVPEANGWLSVYEAFGEARMDGRTVAANRHGAARGYLVTNDFRDLMGETCSIRHTWCTTFNIHQILGHLIWGIM